MATKYSVRGLRNSEWVGIALLSDEIKVEENLYYVGMSLLDACPPEIENVQIVNMDTGEILWDADENVDYGDDDCDNDMGFDPYLGCYTDDC